MNMHSEAEANAQAKSQAASVEKSLAHVSKALAPDATLSKPSKPAVVLASSAGKNPPVDQEQIAAAGQASSDASATSILEKTHAVATMSVKDTIDPSRSSV